jgi:Uma2 family endonuclease
MIYEGTSELQRVVIGPAGTPEYWIVDPQALRSRFRSG